MQTRLSVRHRPGYQLDKEQKIEQMIINVCNIKTDGTQKAKGPSFNVPNEMANYIIVSS